MRLSLLLPLILAASPALADTLPLARALAPATVAASDASSTARRSGAGPCPAPSSTAAASRCPATIISSRTRCG